MEEIKARFEANGQGHVFRFWGDLDASEKNALLSQVREIDVEDLGRIREAALAYSACCSAAGRNRGGVCMCVYVCVCV